MIDKSAEVGILLSLDNRQAALLQQALHAVAWPGRDVLTMAPVFEQLAVHVEDAST